MALALVAFPPALAAAGTVLDRVVATVNGHVILLSDWDEELRFEGFMSGHAVGELSAQGRRAALDRLIDQELVKGEMHGVESEAKPEEIDRQINRLKGEFSRSGSRPSWEAELESYSLTEKILRKHVGFELGEMRLIEERFRPAVRVSPDEIEAYYRKELLPKLPASPPPSLSQASPGIQKLLTEEKINQMLSSWLEALHRQARIRISSGDEGRSAGELR